MEEKQIHVTLGARRQAADAARRGGRTAVDGAGRLEGETIRLTSSRFGELEVPAAKVIRFPEGLLGFPGCHDYVLVQNPSGGPFQWLQSVEEPALAFVAADPEAFFENYRFPAGAADLDPIGVQSVADALVLVLLVVPGDPARITANLQGPLVINPETCVGRQLVLHGQGYTTRHPIFPQSPRQESESDNAAAAASLETVGARAAGGESCSC